MEVYLYLGLLIASLMHHVYDTAGCGVTVIPKQHRQVFYLHFLIC